MPTMDDTDIKRIYGLLHDDENTIYPLKPSEAEGPKKKERSKKRAELIISDLWVCPGPGEEIPLTIKSDSAAAAPPAVTKSGPVGAPSMPVPASKAAAAPEPPKLQSSNARGAEVRAPATDEMDISPPPPEPGTSVSQDDGFILAKKAVKRPRSAVSSASVESRNEFEALDGRGEKGKRVRVPPIIVAAKDKWLEISAALRERGLRFSKAVNTKDGMKVSPINEDDFRQMTALLDKDAVPYMSFDLQSTKPLMQTSADLEQSWHIPRPTLARSSKSSQGSTSSNHSTQSARSGSLLLTAANLALIHTDDKEVTCKVKEENLKYYLEERGTANPLFSLSSENLKKPDPDSVSVASSMHFTVVNVNTRPPVKRRSFCRKHQLTVLVLTMSALFTIGILTAVLLMEMRARKQQY